MDEQNFTTTLLTPFIFETHEINVYLDSEKNPWWEAQQICAALGIHDVSKAVARLRPKERRSESRNLLIINESGLYRLIMRSNKPEAQQFQDWMCETVLPQIRKTGKYESIPQSDPLDKYPELRAIRELVVEIASARDEAAAAHIEAQQATALAQRALDTQQWRTIREYCFLEHLERQFPTSWRHEYGKYLTGYCREHNIPVRTQGIAGHPHVSENAYHVGTLAQTLPGWLKRRQGQSPLSLVPSPETCQEDPVVYMPIRKKFQRRKHETVVGQS